MTICLEKDDCYWEKRNADGEIRERVILDGLEADANSFFMTMADEEGYLHVEDSLASRGGNGKWYIFSPDGKCFHQEQYDSGSFQGLVALPDGRVGYCHGDASEKLANVIDSMDVRTGEKKSIFYDVKNIASDHKIYAIAAMGDGAYVFVDELGIHQGDDTHEEELADNIELKNNLMSFRETFREYTDYYTVIGGTACMILMEEASRDFRATKDIDMILIMEDGGKEFCKTFWEYILRGKYMCGY